MRRPEKARLPPPVRKATAKEIADQKKLGPTRDQVEFQATEQSDRGLDASAIMDAYSGYSTEDAPSQPEDALRRSCERHMPLAGRWGPLDVPPGLSNGLDGKRCEGLDPRKVPLDVLTAAGHPPRGTRKLVSAFNQVMGGEIFSAAFNRIKRHKDIRTFCLECGDGNAAEVRRCCTFWCPFWPYRQGSNPHRPQMPEERRTALAERLRRARDGGAT